LALGFILPSFELNRRAMSMGMEENCLLNGCNGIIMTEGFNQTLGHVVPEPALKVFRLLPSSFTLRLTLSTVVGSKRGIASDTTR
jgi:hypothetical protein